MAGESGKVFAIIANDVKNLSNKSNEAVENVVEYNSNFLQSVNMATKDILSLQSDISQALSRISNLKENIINTDENGIQRLSSIKSVTKMADSIRVTNN